MKRFSKFIQESIELDEKLKASDDMGDWVKDFQDSDAPQFKGKSQKKRQQMAVAAKLAANEEVELDESIDHNQVLVKEVPNRFDSSKTTHQIMHSDKKIISSLKKNASDHAKKHLAGAYRDGSDIVHKATGKTMATIKKGTTMGDLHKQVHNYIDKNHPQKAKSTVEHPSNTRSIVSASDEHAANLKNKFHGKDSTVRIMKRKEGNKVYIDSKNPEHHKTVVSKLNSMHEEVELDEISRDLARRYIRKVADKTNTGELSTKQVMKRKPGVTLAGKKAYPGVAGEPKVRATESVEQIDEISKKTIGSYVKKASSDMASNAYNLGARDPLKKPGSWDKAFKRKAGIEKATDRLTKEEVALDEVSSSTLGSYISKADANRNEKDRSKGINLAVKKKYPSLAAHNKNSAKVNATEEVEIDEERKSSSYQFTHKPGDAESEKKLADLKKSVKGTGKRVVLQGRLGKDNPNAHKYSKDAPRAKYVDGKRVNSDVSGKSGGHSHQRIQKADAAHHDVYVYNRKESVELDEVSDKKLDAYRQKAFADQPSGDDGSDKYRKRKFGRDLAFAKQTGRAKVLATKESAEELDELKKSTLGSYVNRAANDISHIQRDITSSGTKSPDYKNLSRMRRNRKTGIATAVKKLTREEVEINEALDLRVTKVYNKFPKKATYAVHTLDRKYYKEFDTEADAKKHLETKK